MTQAEAVAGARRHPPPATSARRLTRQTHRSAKGGGAGRDPQAGAAGAALAALLRAQPPPTAGRAGARAPAAHFLCCVTVCRLLCSESLPLGAACGCSTVTAVCALASRYLVTCARANPRVGPKKKTAARGVAGAQERI